MSGILATGDVHLWHWPSLPQVDRLADQRAALEQIVGLAYEREVDVVVIAGDVFHKPDPLPCVLETFREFTVALAQAAIPVVAIVGNVSHDLFSSGDYAALQLFDDAITVRRFPDVVDVAGYSIACLPSVPVSELVAKQGGGDRDEVNALAAELLLDVAGELRQRCTGHPLLAAHWSVSGASFPNGLPVDAGHEPVLSATALDHLGYDAVVAGHIHRFQFFPGGFYVGSPMPLDHGEEGYPHGVVLLDEVGAEFVPIESRAFVTLAFDHDDPAAQIALSSSLGWDIPDGAIVRVQVKATQEQWRRIDAKALAAEIRDAGASIVRVMPELVRADRARAAGLTEDLDELDAVRMYTAAQDIGWPHDEALVALTKGYLESEAVPS